MGKLKITVITICYNAQDGIEDTIKSVFTQKFYDYEYLIIDGLSTDNTINIANMFKPQFEKKGIHYKIYSQKDSGIYDAMNKGIDKAQGEWVIFMNAGDCFFSERVLNDVSECQKNKSADIIYGSTVVSDGIHFQFKKGSSPMDLPQHIPFYHQSAFVKLNLLKEYYFDTTYKIAGDYDLFVRLWKAGKRFEYIPVVVSLFDLNGVSSKKLYRSDKEVFMVKTMYKIPTKSMGYILFIEYIKGVRRFIIKKIFSNLYYSQNRGWYYEKTCGGQVKLLSS